MTETTPGENAGPQRKLGPVLLSPGIKPVNAITLFYSAMFVIVYITAFNVLHPFILREHLLMPTEVWGNFTGNLAVMTELLILALVVPIGVASDRIGRRPIITAAFLIYAVGFALVPLATSAEAYIAFRLITAAGAGFGVVMISSLIADYPDNSSRGKMIGINGVCTGLGVTLIAAFGFGHLPEFFVDRGNVPTEAGRYTFWIAAAIAVITAGITWAGIKGGRAATHADRPSFLETTRVALRTIRGNPKLILGCGAAYVSRGDLTVLAAFFTLWLVAVGTDAGMDAAGVQADAGRLFGISQFGMLLSTPIVGWFVDRVDRVTALSVAMALAAVGYTALGIVGDPLNNPWIYAVAILAGMGEAAVIVTVPGLVGQEAPMRVRGSVFGFIAFAGTIGVLVNVKLSGIIFDAWMYQAPFLLMGGLNFIVFVWAAIVRLKCGPTVRDRTGGE